MRSILKVIFATVLTLSLLISAYQVSLAISDSGIVDQQQGVCSDHNIPCTDLRVITCLRCNLITLPSSTVSEIRRLASSTESIVVSKGGTYKPGSIKLEPINDTFRLATVAEIADLNAQIAALTVTMPEPTLERDRMFAEILGNNGFIFDQVQVLQLAASSGGLGIHPEDTAKIMQLYEQLGLPEVAVDYGNWSVSQLPVYNIYPPTGGSYYLDYWAPQRVEILSEATSIIERAPGLMNAEAWLGALNGTIDVTEELLDRSAINGIVFVPGDVIER